MITQSLDLSPLTVEKLFNEGTCLTFDPRLSNTYCDAVRNVPANVWATSSIAKLSLEKLNPPFHYFSNGVLIHSFYNKNDVSVKLKQIEKIISSKGYKIKTVYGPQNAMEFIYYSDFLQTISTTAIIKYSVDTNIQYEPIPDKKTFVKNCFKNGNILLTASESEKYRQCLALFENGDFFVSDKYRVGNSICDPNLPTNFKHSGKYEFFLTLRYVPQEYIDALYKNIKKTDLQNTDANLQDTKNNEMFSYIENLIQNRKCISITYPTDTEYYVRPNCDFFVLFNDGKLILSNERSKSFNDYKTDLLKKIYPNIEFDIEYVPEHYIENIYQKLSQVQKTAKEIYIEILKQKAKHLKKMLGIPHLEALELSAKMVGFKSFKEALKTNEDNARYAIYEENRKKKNAAKKEKDYIEEEYKKYVKSK